MKKYLKYASFLFVVFIVLIILFDQVIMPIYTKHNDEFILPDVTLLNKNFAFNKLEDLNLTPIVKDSVFDENIKQGSVILQYPLPFSKVKNNRKVYLTISRGVQINQMPDFRGLTIREVRFQLQDLYLKEGILKYKENPDFPEGVVYKQSPDPGEAIVAGEKINFYISLGSGTVNKRLPKLVGLNLIEAKKRLRSLKISNIKFESEKNESLLPGTIMKQIPEKGTPILEIKEVILTVSK